MMCAVSVRLNARQRPGRVVAVHHIIMSMACGPVAMRMAMRLGTFPAFMFVLMMLVVNMKVSVVDRLMGVGDHLRVVRRPQTDRGDQREAGNDAENDKRGVQVESGAEPAGQRIGDQPAGMRKRKLRSEYGRAIF